MANGNCSTLVVSNSTSGLVPRDPKSIQFPVWRNITFYFIFNRHWSEPFKMTFGLEIIKCYSCIVPIYWWCQQYDTFQMYHYYQFKFCSLVYLEVYIIQTQITLKVRLWPLPYITFGYSSCFLDGAASFSAWWEL